MDLLQSLIGGIKEENYPLDRVIPIIRVDMHEAVNGLHVTTTNMNEVTIQDLPVTLQ